MLESIGAPTECTVRHAAVAGRDWKDSLPPRTFAGTLQSCTEIGELGEGGGGILPSSWIPVRGARRVVVLALVLAAALAASSQVVPPRPGLVRTQMLEISRPSRACLATMFEQPWKLAFCDASSKFCPNICVAAVAGGR